MKVHQKCDVASNPTKLNNSRSVSRRSSWSCTLIITATSPKNDDHDHCIASRISRRRCSQRVKTKDLLACCWPARNCRLCLCPYSSSRVAAIYKVVLRLRPWLDVDDDIWWWWWWWRRWREKWLNFTYTCTTVAAAAVTSSQGRFFCGHKKCTHYHHDDHENSRVWIVDEGDFKYSYLPIYYFFCIFLLSLRSCVWASTCLLGKGYI